MFDSNKISLEQINICSNQINFCLKANKLYLWPYINALISLFWRKINLIQKNIYLAQIFCLNQTNCISFKRIISLNQRKSFKQIIFFDSIKSFFWVQSSTTSMFFNHYLSIRACSLPIISVLFHPFLNSLLHLSFPFPTFF